MYGGNQTALIKPIIFDSDFLYNRLRVGAGIISIKLY